MIINDPIKATLINKGEIPTYNNGKNISYSVNRNILDFNSINTRAAEAVNKNISRYYKNKITLKSDESQ